MTGTLKLLGSVFKLRIGVFCALASIAGSLAARGSAASATQILAVAMAVLLSAASAGAFNHYWDRDLDSRMKRTQARPFVTGRLTAQAWMPVAMAALLIASVALAAFFAGSLAAAFVFLGAFVYGIVYTVWLKRRSPWNIVVGGLAGSFAVLAGAAAAAPELSPEALALALTLFLWTPPHFWSLAAALCEDYRAAGVPMLPVVVGEARTNQIILANTVALVASSLLPLFLGAGWIYGIAAMGGGAWFIYKSVLLVMRPGRMASMSNFYASLIQLSAIMTAIMVEAAV